MGEYEPKEAILDQKLIANAVQDNLIEPNYTSPTGDEEIGAYCGQRVENILREKYPQLFSKGGTGVIDTDCRLVNRTNSGDGAEYDDFSYEVRVYFGTEEECDNEENLTVSFAYEFRGSGFSPRVSGVMISSGFGSFEGFIADRSGK